MEPDPPRMGIRWRLALLVAAGLVIEGACLYLDRVSIHHAIGDDGAEAAIRAVFHPLESILGAVAADGPDTGENVKLAQLFTGMGIAFLAWLGAVGLILRGPRDEMKVTLGVILTFSAIFRLTLMPFPPLMETDLHRYMLDGAVVSLGISPYTFSPDELRRPDDPAAELARPERERRELMVLRHRIETDPLLLAHFEQINHPGVSTIYPPLTQVLLGVAHLAGGARLMAWKALDVLFDLGILLLVLLFLVKIGRNPALCLLYGWCPLVLKEYANTGHQDPPATFLAMLALWYVWRDHRATAGGLLGLATLAKVYPVVLVMIFITRLGRRGTCVFLLVVAAGYAPFVAASGLDRTLQGLGTFSRRWEFNSSLYALLNRTTYFLIYGRQLPLLRGADLDPGEHPAVERHQAACRFAMGILLLAWLLRIARREIATLEDLLHTAFHAVAGVFLLSPVGDPWYLGWVMPYVALFPSAPWIYLSGSILLHYTYFWNSWGYKPWALLAEYVPFYLMLIGIPEVRRSSRD